MFREYQAISGSTGLVTEVTGGYGVVGLPVERPQAVVSVDFCEVLRQTGRTCGEAMGIYGIEYPYAVATGLQELEIFALVRGLMNAEQVQLTENAEVILRLLQEMRTAGALVIGNTSTLPGCEVATMRFISKHYPGAFDGVNFNTGGHDPAVAKKRTKAWAIDSIMRDIDPTFQAADPAFKVFSIDDRPHHNQSFHDLFAGAVTYMPRCMGEILEPIHEANIIVDSPLQAFQMAHAAIV